MTTRRIALLGAILAALLAGCGTAQRPTIELGGGTEAVTITNQGESVSSTPARARFVYEAARLQAIAVAAPVVPEPWDEREEAFRAQFLDVIEMMCGSDRKSSPAELHDDWVLAYERMGWRYGPTRDPVERTHPDMVPYEDLERREQDKDAVFVALCE